MTKEKLSFRLYVSHNTGKIYPLTADESAIDMDNPVDPKYLRRYKKIGTNNQFQIFELREQYK